MEDDFDFDRKVVSESVSWERTAKRLLSPITTPAAKRSLIRLRDEGVGALSSVRARIDRDRVAPSLLIVGAQKAGTTFLHHQLVRHPQVRAPLTKEIHFFDDHYARGRSWYLGHFSKEGDEPKVSLDSSPNYLFHPHAIDRIGRDLPGARVVVLLRDPTKRAFSQFLHERRLGYEPIADFGEALRREPERAGVDLEAIRANPSRVGFSWNHFSYFERGNYLPQIVRCHKHLGRENVLIVRSEELFERPYDVLERVIEFSDLKPWKPTRLAPNDMAAPPNEQLDPSIERSLRERYEPLNAKLADYLGEPIDW